MSSTLRPLQKNCLRIGALMAWVSVALQFYLHVANSPESIPEIIVRFFSYFTILTNSLVALQFTVLLLEHEGKLYRFFSQPAVQTAVTVYITVVGLVYQFLLRSIWAPTGLQWVVNELLHSVIPLYAVIYYAKFAPKKGLHWKNIFTWLLYPTGYLAFILIRGSFSGFYPYYFIDANSLGYPSVFFNSLGLMLAFVILSFFYILIFRSSKSK